MEKSEESTQNDKEDTSRFPLDLSMPLSAKDSKTDHPNIQTENVNVETVSIINLSYQGIKPFPHSLSSELKVLDLSDYQLESLPAEVCCLTNLTSLFLSKNKLQELPENIGDLKYLSVLKVSHNCLKNIPLAFSKLNQLKDLDFSKNEFSRVPNALQVGCKYLQHINLAHNRLECWPCPPASVHSLCSISLSYNEITVLPMWLFDGHAFMLQSVDISANPIRCEDYRNLRNRHVGQPSPRFAQLNLSSCSFSHTDFDFINRFQSLTRLKIGNYRDKKLNVQFNLLRQIDVSALKCRNCLVELSLRNVSMADLPDDIGSLENLEILDCRENILMMLPESICKLRRLRVLLLSGNEICFLPDKFGDLTDLVELRMEHNRVTGLPESFPNLKNLLWLDLYENEITAFPEQLEYLVGNLKGLDLELNYFNVTIVWESSEVPVDWLSQQKYEEMLDEIRNHFPPVEDHDHSNPPIRSRGNRQLPNVREDEDSYSDSSIEERNKAFGQDSSYNVDYSSRVLDLAMEEESWDDKNGDSDDNFDPTKLTPAPSVTNRSTTCNRQSGVRIIEIPVHIFKPYSFCPSDYHVPSVRTLTCEVTFPPEEGQFDDA